MAEISINPLIESCLEQEIQSVNIVNNVLTFTLSGLTLEMKDDNQGGSSRYMVCDDNLGDFIGATLLGAKIVEGGTEPLGEDEREINFLIINTSVGEFTVANYNEHNGYYSGISVVANITQEEI